MPNRLGISLALLGLTASFGCDTPSQPQEALGPRSLIDHMLWRSVPYEEDPFEQSDGDVTRCEFVDAIITEDLGGESTLAIRTDACNRATVVQPSISPVSAGENVAIRVWNWRLARPQGALAHIEIRFGIHSVLAVEREIPSPSALHPLNWRAPEALPAGTPIYFHIRNHGQNEYNFVEMSAGRTLDLPAEETP